MLGDIDEPTAAIWFHERTRRRRERRTKRRRKLPASNWTSACALRREHLGVSVASLLPSGAGAQVLAHISRHVEDVVFGTVLFGRMHGDEVLTRQSDCSSTPCRVRLERWRGARLRLRVRHSVKNCWLNHLRTSTLRSPWRSAAAAWPRKLLCLARYSITVMVKNRVR